MKDMKMQDAKKRRDFGEDFFEKSYNDDYNLCITCMSSQKLLILASKTYPIYFGNQLIVVSGYPESSHHEPSLKKIACRMQPSK